MIANALKDRTDQQVKCKVYDMFRSKASNPIKICLKGISIDIDEQHVWTEKEDARFIKMLLHHGKDYKKLMKCFPKLSYTQIRNHVKLLKSVIHEDNNHSHLQEVLEKKPSWSWSKEEEETFITMFKKYGKNYKLIKAKIPTKTL